MGYKVNNVSVLDSSDTQGDFRADFNTIIVKKIQRPGNSTTKLNYKYQGENYGYSSGGSPFLTPYFNNSMGTISRFSLASDGDGTDHGDLSQSRYGGAGVNSSTNAYIAGGLSGPWGSPALTKIEKFPFAAGAGLTATDTTAELSPVGRVQYDMGSHNNHSYGYFTGGGYGTANEIIKYVFATDASDCSDIGDLTLGRSGVAGSSSDTHGYASGGYPYYSGRTIDKFPFSADGDASGVGDLTYYVYYAAGGSSSTHGYSAGGGFYYNYIQKYPFATDNSASDIADLNLASNGFSSHSSTTHGYACGGRPDSGGGDYIQKYSFVSDQNGTDIGDLDRARRYPIGNHY